MMAGLQKVADTVAGWFAPRGGAVPAPPTDHEGWERSAAYGGSGFARYNPDDLLGRKGYGIYSRMMLDEQVKAVVHFKRDAIKARGWYFELDDEELGEKEAAFRIALFEEIVRRMHGSFSDALDKILSAIYQGFSMTEIVFAQIVFEKRTWWGLDELALKPFETFYFHTDEYGHLEKVEQKIAGKTQQIDPARFIHHVNNPEVDKFYGSSDLREAHRPWFSKDVALKSWDIWLERHGSGMAIARPAEGKKVLVRGSQEWSDLVAVLKNLQTKTSMILPAGIELDVKYPDRNVNFERRIGGADKAIAKALLVPNLLGLSEQGETGSYSQSRTQENTFLWTLGAIAESVEETLDEQLFQSLGDYNFGDGRYPRFRFHPLSEEKKLAILAEWREHVRSGSVRATETDERHVRDMLNMPEAGDPLPTRPDQQPGQPGAGQPDNPAGGRENPRDGGGAPGRGEEGEQLPSESIVGRRGSAEGISLAATGRAMKRVNFAVIDRGMQVLTEEGASDLGQVMATAVADLAAKIEAEGLGTPETGVEAIQALKFDPKHTRRLKNHARARLEAAWKLGLRDARNEIDRAQGSREYAARMDFIALEEVAAQYFEAKSFQLAGRLSADAVDTVKDVLLRGLKGSKSTSQIIEDIYLALARKGVIPLEAAREALGGRLGDISNPDARLVTVIRTNVTEAINEARNSFFSDPALGTFVQGMLYAAILDGVTTMVCQHLDGKTYKLDSEVWSIWRPPNHFNCRSLLVAVTENDAFEESPFPIVQPQEGFG